MSLFHCVLSFILGVIDWRYLLRGSIIVFLYIFFGLQDFVLSVLGWPFCRGCERL